MHTSDECWIGIHENCSVPQWCMCACHALNTEWVTDDWEDEEDE